LLPMGRNRQKVTGKTRAGKQRAPQNKKPAELAIAVNGRGDGRYTATVRTHNRERRYYRKTFACSDECHAQKLAAAFALIISPDRWDCARQSTDAKFTTSIGNGIRTAMQEVWEQEQSKAKQMLAEEQERHTSTQIGTACEGANRSYIKTRCYYSNKPTGAAPALRCHTALWRGNRAPKTSRGHTHLWYRAPERTPALLGVRVARGALDGHRWSSLALAAAGLRFLMKLLRAALCSLRARLHFLQACDSTLQACFSISSLVLCLLATTSAQI
jgi:hypothetical protein